MSERQTITCDNGQRVLVEYLPEPYRSAEELRDMLIELSQMTVETTDGAFPTKPALDKARALLSRMTKP
jgi:hypothetical protein